MISSTLLIFAVAILNVYSVACVGTASILNFCDLDVYVWSVADVPNDTVNHLAPKIGVYSEPYRENPNGGGVSLKIATNLDITFITQFEYTYHAYYPNVSYDISNINGYPFEQWGLYLPSPSLNCPSVSCNPGVPLCPDVYNQPHDDYATQSCNASVNLILTLCPPQSSDIVTVNLESSSTMAATVSSETVTTTVMTTTVGDVTVTGTC